MNDPFFCSFLILSWCLVFVFACKATGAIAEKRSMILVMAIFILLPHLPELVGRMDINFTEFVAEAEISPTTSIWLLSIFALLPMVHLCVSSFLLLGVMLPCSKYESFPASSRSKFSPIVTTLIIISVFLLTAIMNFFLVNPHVPLLPTQGIERGIEQKAPLSAVRVQTARAKLAVSNLDIGGIHDTAITSVIENGILTSSVILTVIAFLLVYLLWWILIQERLVVLLIEKRWLGMLLGLSAFIIFNGMPNEAFATLALLTAVSIPLYLLFYSCQPKWLIRILFLIPFVVDACWEAITALCLSIAECAKIFGLQ